MARRGDAASTFLRCLDATVKTIGAGKNIDRPTFTSISGDVTGDDRSIRLSEYYTTLGEDLEEAPSGENFDANRENPRHART